MKKDTIIAVLATFCLTATLFMVSSSLGYDPWADINEDGRIDMRDIAYEASLFGSSGDPTKNVTVMNWPTHKNTAVWYAESLTSGEVELSPFYNASGFSRLHILMGANGLSFDESIVIEVRGLLFNAAHSAWWPIVAYTRTLSNAGMEYDVVMSVPSEEFQFVVRAATGTTCSISLSFYLTWG
jgi:hypothetical protein